MIRIHLLAGASALTVMLASPAAAGPTSLCTLDIGPGSTECGPDSTTGGASNATAIGNATSATVNSATAVGDSAQANGGR